MGKQHPDGGCTHLAAELRGAAGQCRLASLLRAVAQAGRRLPGVRAGAIVLRQLFSDGPSLCKGTECDEMSS